ncbi:MAG: FAD-binding oxidoreductase, partial [Rhodospirillaceae bacterium]|nr:FAD-binding oxidoreductase [Rhodospirillaceae bacterium]
MNDFGNIDDAVLAALGDIVGDRVSTGKSVRDLHGRDLSFHHDTAPDAVVFPETTDEVAAIVKVCAAHRVPVIPFGAGSSLEGQLMAV